MITLKDFISSEEASGLPDIEAGLLLTQLRNLANEYGKDNLNGFIEDDSGYFPEKALGVFNRFIEEIGAIYRQIDYEAIIDSEDEDEGAFWGFAIDICLTRLNVIDRMSNLYSLDIERRHELFDAAFMNYILYQNPFAELDGMGYTDELIELARMVLLQSQILVFINRAHKDAFAQQTSFNYGFAQEDIDHIWQLFQENKQDIQFAMLMNKLGDFEERYYSEVETT